MCVHLDKTLLYLEQKHGLKVIEKVNGKGWGNGHLVSGSIPFKQIIRERQLDGGVTASEEHGMISCRACWESIAEYARYKSHWG